MWHKIVKAAFEGTLIRKSLRFIFVKIPVFLVAKLPVLLVVKLPTWLIKKADGLMGRILRYLYCRFSKVDNNKIVFMTYTDDYMCNPKYIAEEIIRQGLDWDLVWIVPHKGSMRSSHFPPCIRRVRRNTYNACKEIATAKVWIDNSINFLWYAGITKKPEQVYIETWHGSMGIKRVGKDDVKQRKWVKVAKKVGEITSYCISNSDFETDVYRTTHWPKTPVWMFGHPRNDELFNKEKCEEVRQKIVQKYNLDPEDQFILYAPTFRDSGHTDCYDIDYEALVESLQQRFDGNWKVLLRLHFHDRKMKLKKSAFPECVVNVTSYPDMQELIQASDAGITDYSSWAYDFVLTRRPLFIYATDLEEYNTERGLYFPLETTPFPIATDNPTLLESVARFDDQDYQRRIDEFLAGKGCVEDGHAAERVVEELKKIMGEKK